MLLLEVSLELGTYAGAKNSETGGPEYRPYIRHILATSGWLYTDGRLWRRCQEIEWSWHILAGYEPWSKLLIRGPLRIASCSERMGLLRFAMACRLTIARKSSVEGRACRMARVYAASLSTLAIVA